MAFVKYGRFEKDTYKINSTTSNYIHNHYDNFEKVLDHNNISFDGLYKNFKNLWSSMLTDLIATWEEIRKLFIQKFVEQEKILKNKDKAYDPVFKDTDPEKFLKDYNSYFKEIQKEDSLVLKLQEIKDSTILVSDQLGGIPAIKESTTKTDNQKTEEIIGAQKEALKIIKEVWRDLIGMVSTLMNNQSLDGIVLKSFLLEAKGRKEMEKEEGVFEVNYDFFTKKILKIFKDKFRLKQKDIKGIREKLEEIKKLTFDDMTDGRKIIEIYKKFTLGVIAGAAGYLLEQGMIEVIVNNELFSMVAKLDENDSVSKISYTGSERMKQRFVGDHLTASFKYDDKTVRAFTSDKLTRSLDIGSKLHPKEYTVPNDPVLTNYKWDGENRDVLKWMRYNFNTLKILNLGKGSRESLSEIPDEPFQSYFNLEKGIASLLIIPRFVEGVVDFAENVKGVYGKNGEIYHTAMLYSRGEFIWTVDILKKLQEIMNSSNSWEEMSEKGIAIQNFRKAPKPIMTEEEVYALYTKKIEALKNNNIKNYEQLMQIAGIADTVLEWKPIHKVDTWMQFSKILGKK